MIEWRVVEEYEGRYQVSDDGQIRSLARQDTRGNRLPDLVLKQQVNHKGYNRVNLCKDSRVTSHAVHRLVALAFIPNPHNKPQVNHIDANKQNNNIHNLEWVTSKEDGEHRSKHGLCYKGKNVKTVHTRLK